MTLRGRRILLWILNIIGTGVGTWALFWPTRFYDSFPGVGFGAWIRMDGPYNEHLIRDVGELNLGLVAGGVIAALALGSEAARAIGAVWLVYSVPHVLYHVQHLDHLTRLDQVGQVVSLSSTVVLALPLLLPERRPAHSSAAAGSTTGSENHS